MLALLNEIQNIGEWTAKHFKKFLDTLDLDSGKVIYDKKLKHNKRFLLRLDASMVTALAGANPAVTAEYAVKQICFHLETVILLCKRGRSKLAPFKVSLWQDMRSTEVVICVDSGWDESH